MHETKASQTSKIRYRDSSVGKRFAIQKREGTIVGLVKDAHFRSFHHEIEPRVFFIANMALASDAGLVLIKILGGKTEEALSHMRHVWEGINSISPFEYHFLDQAYDRLYRSEKRVGTVFNCFTALAIFISCLGLFGLASFMAEQRTKEIGLVLEKNWLKLICPNWSRLKAFWMVQNEEGNCGILFLVLQPCNL